MARTKQTARWTTGYAEKVEKKAKAAKERGSSPKKKAVKRDAEPQMEGRKEKVTEERQKKKGGNEKGRVVDEVVVIDSDSSDCDEVMGGRKEKVTEEGPEKKGKNEKARVVDDVVEIDSNESDCGEVGAEI